MKGQKSHHALWIFAGLAAVWLQFYFSDAVLTKGQAIKQFHAHAISQSLSENGFRPLRTYLPCRDRVDPSVPQRWVEEPPVFHLFGALLIKLGLKNPALPGFVVSLAMMVVMALWAGEISSNETSLLWLLVAATPVFMRYFSQHMPDGLAALFLAWGAWDYLRGRWWGCGILFALACATKFLAVPAVLMILSSGWWFGTRRDLRSGLASLGIFAASVLPFLAWLWILRFERVPNPFVFGSLLENRHSGQWEILLEPKFWAHFVTWVIVKGVGIPLFLFYALGAFSVGSVRRFGQRLSAERLLWFWSLGLWPYWIFVRQGNFTHDYYFLPFFLPIALLGAKHLLQLKSFWLKTALIAWSLAVGLTQPWSLAKNAHHETPGADPSYCGVEAGRGAE